MATVTVTTPKKTHTVDPTVVAADITKFGGTAIAVLTAVLNTAPGVQVPAGWQAVIAAVVGLAASLQAVLSRKTTTAAA